MKNPLISIITPIFNINDQLIVRLLQSIYNTPIDQSLFEIILVDDGSKPSVNLQQNPYNRATNLHLIRQENKGLGAARNKAIPHAKGKYLYFVDADDYLFSENLHYLFQNLEDEIYDLAIVRWEIVHSLKTKSHKNKSSKNKQWESAIEYGTQNHWHGGIARYIFSRKIILEKKILFPENVWHEDELFITKALFYSQKTLFIDRSIYAYYQRIDSITQKKSHAAILKRANDRLTALLQIDQWIKSLPDLKQIESNILLKKRDFLIVDILISLCKETTNKELFIEQYKKLIELKFLPLPNKPYGIKYQLFRKVTLSPKILQILAPIIKKYI